MKKRKSFYYRVYGPWGGTEDNNAYVEACAKYDELEKIESYLVLIQSHHFATPGYWVENHKTEIKYPDHILKQKQS